jgi:hypothetical protein
MLTLKNKIILIVSILSIFLIIKIVGSFISGLISIFLFILYTSFVLYETNFCKPGSCNGMMFIPSIFFLIIGVLFLL